MRKALRLKKPADFKKVFKEGKRFISPRFVLYIRKNKLDSSRFGVSISKRHCKLATKRNRLRRKAKEFFRTKIYLSLKGCDAVVASRAALLKTKTKEAELEIVKLLAKKK